MIDAAVIMLWLDGRLPFIALGLIVLRDIVLVGGYRIFAGKGVDLNVSMLGKVATWILYASLCLHHRHDRRHRMAALALLDRPRARGGRRNPVRQRHVAAGEREDGVKAVVMAGGEGTRLRPLTSNQPKPMVPIVGKPCMEHILELLRRHGFEDVIVTLAFLPQAIRGYFGDGEALGMHVEYSVEDAPMGTAGSVRMALGEARRDVPRHLGRRALRLRPDGARGLPPRARRRR